MKEFMTHSPEQTEEVGRTLAENLKGGETLVLRGNLGAGKTRLTKGIAKGLGVSELVTSPTFTIQNVYAGRLKLYHFDMYRITGEDDLASVGFDDYLTRPGICLVEWSENIPYALPDAYVRVCIEKDRPGQPDSRRITIEQIGEARL